MQSAVNTERVCIIKQKSLSVTRAISKKTESFSAFPALVEEGFEDDSWESGVRLEQGAFSNEPNKRQKIDRESGNNGS